MGVSIVKTIVYNLKLFSLNQALDFPIVVGKNTIIKAPKGNIVVPKGGKIKIGVSCGLGTQSFSETKIIVKGEGKLFFGNKADLWKGTIISVFSKGVCRIGNDFIISGNSCFKIYRSLSIGDGCLFSTDIKIMDYDGHRIFNENGERINDHKPIIIKNHVWVGMNTSIWSGAIIPDGSIIGNGSFISNALTNNNSIYVKNGIIVRENVHWEY